MNDFKTLSFVNNGVRWTARLVLKGDHYGNKFCLTNTDDEPLVEFYDADQDPNRFTYYGQFVSRYNLSTMLERSPGGLNLEGGVPRWSINAASVALVQTWAEHALETIDTLDRYNAVVASAST